MDDAATKKDENEERNNRSEHVLHPCVRHHEFIHAEDTGLYYVTSVIWSWRMRFYGLVSECIRNRQNNHEEEYEGADKTSTSNGAHFFGFCGNADGYVSLAGDRYCEPRRDTDGHVENIMSIGVEVGNDSIVLVITSPLKQDTQEVEDVVY